MESELKVGDFWVGTTSGAVREILFIGETALMLRDERGNEYSTELSGFDTLHSKIDKPKEVALDPKELMKDIEYLTDAIQDSRLAIIRSDEIRAKYNLK